MSFLRLNLISSSSFHPAFFFLLLLSLPFSWAPFNWWVTRVIEGYQLPGIIMGIRAHWRPKGQPFFVSIKDYAGVSNQIASNLTYKCVAASMEMQLHCDTETRERWRQSVRLAVTFSVRLKNGSSEKKNLGFIYLFCGHSDDWLGNICYIVHSPHCAGESQNVSSNCRAVGRGSHFDPRRSSLWKKPIQYLLRETHAARGGSHAFSITLMT